MFAANTTDSRNTRDSLAFVFEVFRLGFEFAIVFCQAFGMARPVGVFTAISRAFWVIANQVIAIRHFTFDHLALFAVGLFTAHITKVAVIGLFAAKFAGEAAIRASFDIAAIFKFLAASGADVNGHECILK